MLAAILVLLAPSAEIQEEQTAGFRGLPVSAPAPSFKPTVLSGRLDEGTCPVTLLGNRAQVQVWVQEDAFRAGLDLTKRLDSLGGDVGPDKLRSYMIVTPKSGGELGEDARLRANKSGLLNGYVLQVPSWSDEATSALYGHSDREKPAMRVYLLVNQRVYARWDNPTSFPEIEKSIRNSLPHIVPAAESARQIAPSWEAGEKMIVEFEVVDGAGKPLANAKIDAWQTDREGHYNPNGWDRRMPRLNTTALTDSQGKIQFQTIRPGAYPSGAEPAHIHFGVTPAGGAKTWRTLWFEGDPLLTEERRGWAERDAETVVEGIRQEDGVWRIRHRMGIGR